MSDDNSIVYETSSLDYAGGRIPSTHRYRTTWQKDPFKLLKYEYCWRGATSTGADRWRTVLEDARELRDKFAISKHRHAVMIILKLKEPKRIEEVKIIYSYHGDEPQVGAFVETPKTFISGGYTRLKAYTRWCYWTPEKGKLLQQYEEKSKELRALRCKILEDTK